MPRVFDKNDPTLPKDFTYEDFLRDIRLTLFTAARIMAGAFPSCAAQEAKFAVKELEKKT